MAHPEIIRFEDADHRLSWSGVVDALAAGHKLPRAEIGDLLLREKNRSLLNRGAWIPGLGMALKSMSVFPDNPGASPPQPSIQGAVLLFDDKNGAVKAVLDGILVTKWKTAGDSMLGARLLAPPSPETLLVIGAGTVARSLFQAYSQIFPGLRKYTLWNRNIKRAEELAGELAGLGMGIEVAGDLEKAAADADIISCATMAVEPVLKGDWVSPGTHVDLIGAYRPDMREADDTLLRKSELFVDCRDTTLHDIGELRIPLENGVITESDVRGDLYDLCSGGAGRSCGRSSEQSITVFKNGGGAHLDLMTSAYICASVAEA